MELLQSPENREYPTDYLLARLRGRRVYLIRDWNHLLFSSNPYEYLLSTFYKEFITEQSIEGVWIYLSKEFHWVYFQMNRRLRNIFGPFFLYFEMKMLLFCLRNKFKKGTEENVERLLSYSLLSEKVKKVLREKEDLIYVLEKIEEVFVGLSDKFGELKELFVKNGLKDVERHLTDSYLEFIIGTKINPLIKSFFAYLIDTRNVIAIYKHLRWDISTYPPILHGGSIEVSKLRDVFDKHEISGIGNIIYKLTGIIVEELTVTNVEISLFKGLTKFLKKTGKDPLSIGLILNYLWRCYMEAKNLSIILYGKELDRNLLTGEVIQQ